ncbi:unnamed protein product [Hydatigera taeniaeformis]|uniref:Integrator complex subunit 7 n=1 Tax=Hydatigena taeniaeformis TaxID=6205 RepID=A0A0R3WNX8_HYDTA|nr:unnamed protein product [Hydatigera taeniaeformis]
MIKTSQATFIDDSERWWLCQVLGSLFELIALLPRSRPLPASFVAICTSLCTRAVNLLASFCTCSGVETRLKALRKLCTIAILDGPFVPPNLLSYAMKIILQMYPLATARIACEIAYCLEICTMKALTLQDIPEDWSLPSILQVVIGLSARLFPDAKNVVWTGQDGYRCEHALQTLANLVELASKSLDFLDSHYSTVLNVFQTCLHTTNISGAEKIRWNAALASSRLLQTISNGDQLVEALCVAFTTDPYFKVRAYAGLSLLLQLLRVPSIRQTSSILDCCLQFLSIDLKHYFTKLVAADALQYQVVCPYIAERLLLQAGVLSMRALQQNWTEGLRNLNRIVEELEGNETLCENLKNSLKYAKDAKVAATAVVKENADEMARGGLARVPKHPMIISFAERYSLLRTLKLDEAVNELSEAVKTFEREVQIADGDSSLTRELVRGLTRLINAMTIDETAESLQRIHLNSLDDQSSAPSQTTDGSAVD